ncbi:hypothetical protein JX265_004856 [Neoarthrinium moseri]|uniref:hydroxymethylglutaryl-CoA lyase n=1 Tax=Neoarthrinium moseri TaxID=1658444 RepID=A0A9P9WQ65_9PEZI|nr:hypothetical protein JX266_007107 [Neoarthrinium moseri]KAI1874648.1 hypothetical protein JX265_004856 [Neoarthrinium moseri]
MQRAVTIVEVGPRDGLQNIRQQVPTQVKLQLIDRLHDAGLRNIELTSFVSPKAVPQLKDGHEILSSPSIRSMLQNDSLRLPVLVPNLNGAKTAVRCGAKHLAVFVSASEGFSKANTNCTVKEGLERAKLAAREAKFQGLEVRGYVSCIFSDPFDGPTPPEAVLIVVQKLMEMGCYEVSLGDTLGVGSPANVQRLIAFLANNDIPLHKLAGHFHDTYGQALANVWEAHRCGLRIFDSSVAGLGGCPFAPGAQGNVATEDLVYMFETAGISTGINLQKLMTIGDWISRSLSRKTASRAGAALAVKGNVECSKSSTSTNPPTAKREALPWILTQQTDGLLVHRCGVNLKVTMNRPHNGNALTVTMIEHLVKVFIDASNDSTVHRIALTGNGKFFCTGMDLGKRSTTVGTGGPTTDSQLDRLSRLFNAIDRCPKVTIAALNGPAFGGGVGLAFACDLRLCAKSASVTLSEVKLGLCPATISKYIIREWGIPLSREAMLTGRPVSPEELQSKGVIVRVTEDPDQLEHCLDSLISALKIASSDASRMCKELVRTGWVNGGHHEQDEAIKSLFGEMMRPGAPGNYGVREFQAGNKVDWDNYSQKLVSKI